MEYLAKIVEYYQILLNTFTKFGNKTMNPHEYSRKPNLISLYPKFNKFKFVYRTRKSQYCRRRSTTVVVVVTSVLTTTVNCEL